MSHPVHNSGYNPYLGAASTSSVDPGLLTRACKTDLPRVKQAIANGARPDAFTLDTAIQSSNAEMVQLVVSAGAQPSHSTLTSACRTRQLDIVRSAVLADAKPDDSTMDIAIDSENVEIVRLARSQNAKASPSALTRAVKTGSYEIMNEVGKVASCDAQTYYAASARIAKGQGFSYPWMQTALEATDKNDLLNHLINKLQSFSADMTEESQVLSFLNTSTTKFQANPDLLRRTCEWKHANAQFFNAYSGGPNDRGTLEPERNVPGRGKMYITTIAKERMHDLSNRKSAIIRYLIVAGGAIADQSMINSYQSTTITRWDIYLTPKSHSRHGWQSYAKQETIDLMKSTFQVSIDEMAVDQDPSNSQHNHSDSGCCTLQ